MKFHVIGDINIDLMKIDSNRHIKMLADSLTTNNVTCAISNLTRITVNSKTLIDHVYTNNANENVLSGIAYTADVYDHHGMFIDIPLIKCKRNQHCSTPALIQDMSKFERNKFVENLFGAFQSLNLAEEVSVHSRCCNLVQALKKAVDIHAPYCFLSQKQPSLQQNLGSQMDCLNLFVTKICFTRKQSNLTKLKI